MSEGWKVGAFSFGNGVSVERFVVLRDAVSDADVLWLVGLNNNIARMIAATDATAYLRNKLEDALAGLVVGECQTTICLHDTDGAKLREVETFCNYLGADDNIYSSVVQFLVALVECFCLSGVSVKTGNIGFWKKFLQFFGDELGADAFVNNICGLAVWARGRDFFLVVTDMANKGE